MLNKKHLVVIVILASYLYSVDCRNYVDCDPAKSSSEKSNSECPINSQCVELGIKNSSSSNISAEPLPVGGLCACKVNYTFNRNFSQADKTSLYCLEVTQTTISPQPPTIVVSTAAPSTTISTTTKKQETLKTSTAPPPQVTTKKIEPTTKASNESPKNSKNNDKQPEEQKQEKIETPTHHMLGGIVLPVMIVLAFIGAVYGIRRYDILERAQNYIRNRRNGSQPHQTRYDGLENDFDDDPLLI